MFTHYASLPRLYVSDPLTEGDSLTLTKEASHYVCTVLRRENQDYLRVFNGTQGEHLAQITNTNTKACRVIIKQLLRPQEVPPSLTLIFAPLRKERLHFLIEKAIELGVTHLYPMITARTVHRNFNQARSLRHIIEATEQSERLSLAQLSDPIDLRSLLGNWPRDKTIFFCKERSGSEPLAQSLLNNNAEDPAFLVGPEGGLTTEEALLLESYPFVRAISLGYHILRSETAAISALGFWGLYYKAQKEL